MSDLAAFTPRFLSAPEYLLAAFEKLLAQLSDVPTTAGPTPRQHQNGLVQIEATKEMK